MKKILTFTILLFAFPIYAQWWTQQNSGVTANLNDVYCITEDIVVIVGSGGTVLKTIDGGTNWIQKTSNTTIDLEKIQFVNATTGYAVGSNGTLLKTIDVGENWTSIPTGITINLHGLSCINENIFYISGDNGLIKRTNDGGTTFIDQSHSTEYPVKTIQFLNEQVGYASCYNQYGQSDGDNFIKTTDGGLTWSLLSIQYASTFYFLNENIGFIRDGNGISKTIDGGLNKTYIGEIGFITADIFSLNENVIWNVEDNFTLCNCSYFCVKKIDLNLVPELQNASNCYSDTNGDSPFKAIHFASDTKGYAVGDWGKILKNSTGVMENLSTNKFDEADRFKISPNPSSDIISISFLEKQTESFSIEITDFLGKKVLSKWYENQNDTTVNIESFSNGVYFVKLQSNKGNVIKKLIKE